MENYMEVFEVLPQPCLLLKQEEDDILIQNVNRAFLQTTGLKKGQLLQQCFGKLLQELGVTRSCQSIIKNSVHKGFIDDGPVTLEPVIYDFMRKGEESYLSITNIPVECETLQKEPFVLMILSDITSQILKEKEHLFVLEELDRSAERCRHLIDQNTDGLYSMDEHGNFITVNEGLVNLAEVPEKELLTMSFVPFCADHHKEMVWDCFNKALLGDKQVFRADFVSATGRKVILDISLMPLKIQNNIKGVYGIAKDVTEKLVVKEKARRFEEKLLKSEKKFKALVQEGSDMIAIVNEEGYYEFASDSVVNILGTSPKEYVGKSAFDFIHTEDREYVYQEFLQLLESKQVLISPFRVKNAQNEWCWIESKATNLLGDPDVGGIVVNSKDITEAYLQKKKIEELNDRYKFASRATEDLIYDWDLLGNTWIRNRVFEENYGFSKKETKGSEEVWFDRIFEEDKERVVNNIQSALKDPAREKWNEEYRFLKKNGELSYLIDRAYILRDAEGKAMRVVGAVMDITESKEFLRKIEKQNELLKEIAWEQAHVIRAPLARLKTLVDALEDSSFDEWSKEEIIGYIKSSADELDEIILKRIQKIESINA